MPYDDFDDESLRLLTESDDGWEGWEPRNQGEEVTVRDQRLQTRYTPRRGGGTPVQPRVLPPRPVGGLGGASIRTPAGQAQVRFERPLATKESVDELTTELKREIAATAAAVKRVDEIIDKNTSVLDKKTAALEEMVKRAQRQAQQQAQMSLLLPLLTSKAPVIQDMTFAAAPTAGTKTSVTSTTFKKDDNFGLILLMMAMGGGFGGGAESEGGMNSALLLALAFGGLGGSGSGGTTTTSSTP